MKLIRPFVYIPAQVVPYKPRPTWCQNVGRYQLKRLRQRYNESILRWHMRKLNMKPFRISENQKGGV